MIKAVLFDMDGVLVDSVQAWFKIFNKALKRYGKKEFTFQQFLNKVWGGPIERDAKEYFQIPLEELKGFYFSNFDSIKKEFKLFPNTTDVLKKLKSKEFRLALVTNTPKDQACRLISYLKIIRYFDVVVGGDEVKNGKPSPDIVVEACRRLNVDPNEAVMVGDTGADILSCKNAGCTSIGFKIKGDKRIDDLKELLKVI